MAKKFPKVLYVKQEKDAGAEYFTADADPASLVDMGDTIVLARYELKDVQAAKGIAHYGPHRRPR